MNKEEPKYFEFTQLENVGTEKVGIGYSPRTGTYSLSAVARQSRKQQGTTVMHNNIITRHIDWVKLIPSAPDYGEAEINKDKFGHYTPGTKIPIISELEAKKMNLVVKLASYNP